MFHEKWIRRVSAVAIVVGAALSGFAQKFEAGAIVLNPAGLRVPERNAILDQLVAAHVSVIRTGMNTDDPQIDFARRAAARGVKIVALIEPQPRKGLAKIRNQPGQFYRVWGGVDIASLDEKASSVFFQSFLDKLDANGTVLAAIELGNEINWAASGVRMENGRVFNFADLSTDPRAKQVAAYYLDYLKMLAELKEVRDRSKLNRQTPILSAGLATVGAAGDAPNFFTQHGYAVTVTATIHFLRDHGLDRLVDAYAIHYYPREKTAEARKTFMETYAVSVCKVAGSSEGKPCWITEWGVDNDDLSCPVHDGARTALVRETMGLFRDLARQGRLTTALYYTWNSVPGSGSVLATSLYRCGGLSPAGRAAVTP